MDNKYFISLSKDGDYLQKLGHNSWKATYSRSLRTEFDSFEEANKYMSDLELHYFWPQAQIELKNNN